MVLSVRVTSTLGSFVQSVLGVQVCVCDCLVFLIGLSEKSVLFDLQLRGVGKKVRNRENLDLTRGEELQEATLNG